MIKSNMSSNLLQRSSLSKAAMSGASLGLANKLIAKQDFIINQVGLQAGSSYIAPALTDQISSMISFNIPYNLYDAFTTGVIYSGSSGYLGFDNRSFIYKLLISAGSDYTADYMKNYLPSF